MDTSQRVLRRPPRWKKTGKMRTRVVRTRIARGRPPSARHDRMQEPLALPEVLSDRILHDAINLARLSLGWDRVLCGVQERPARVAYQGVLAELIDHFDDSDMPELVGPEDEDGEEGGGVGEASIISIETGVSFDTAWLLVQEVGLDAAMTFAREIMAA